MANPGLPPEQLQPAAPEIAANATRVSAMVTRHKRLVWRLVLVGALGVVGWLIGRQGWAYYHYRAGENALAQREFSAARHHLNKCLHVWSTDVPTLCLAARAAARDGDPGAADEFLQTAERVDAESAALERRILRLRTGDLTEARRYLGDCTANPGTAHAKLVLESLIDGALRSGQPEFAQQCLALWEKTHTGAQDRMFAKAWRGEIAYRTGYPDVAIVLLRAVVDESPRDEAARLLLIEVLIQYAPAEAKAHLEMLMTKRPNDRATMIRLASCQRALGEHEEAVRLLEILLARSPDDVAALLDRGRAALDLGRLDEAEKFFRRAAAVSPQHREVDLALARCLQLAGRAVEAQTYRDKAVMADLQRGR